MPVDRYDKWFGGAPGAAKKALESMKRTYGAQNGEHVFHATVAKRELKAKKTRKK